MNKTAKLKKVLDKKWWEDFEYMVHSTGDDRQVRVYYFPNMGENLPKVIQFQVYNQNDPLRQVSNLLESALFELAKPEVEK